LNLFREDSKRGTKLRKGVVGKKIEVQRGITLEGWK